MQPMITVVCGPTACSKTRLGVALALALDGEVVSADSMQLYRGMEIGTAVPRQAERRGVAHHMLGVADPGEHYSAARYAAEAAACVDDILARGKQPIVVGGTGLYIDALVAGRQFAAGDGWGAHRAALEARAQAEGLAPLFGALCAVDPEAAARISPNDKKRIIRALEVFYETGQTISAHDRATRSVPPRYRAARIGLTFSPREALWARIAQRVDEMMAAGLEAEVRALLAAGVPPSATAMQAIGYKELAAAIQSGGSIADAAALVSLRTRQYAKRQLTWFRRTPDVHWIVQTPQTNFSSVLADSTAFLHGAGVG